MELDAMVGIFADLSEKVAENNKHLSNRLKLPKPLGRTIGGSALATAGVVTNVTTQQACPVGKMWEVRLAGLFGSDTHTAVLGANAAISQPAVPASGTAVQNTNAFAVNVVLAGFTATQVFVNGILVGASNGTYVVPAFGSISVTYSVAGTMTWTNAASGTPATADIFAGSEQDVNTSDFTSVFASAVTIPFVKDYGRRHIDAYPGENVYALVTGAPTNQQLVIVAVVDEWNYSDAEVMHV